MVSEILESRKDLLMDWLWGVRKKAVTYNIKVFDLSNEKKGVAMK